MMNEPLLHFTITNAKVVSECSPNSTAHHMAKYRATKTAQLQAKTACQQALALADFTAIEPPIILTCARYYAGHAKEFDEDALGSIFKPAIDGVKKALGFDDSPRFMTIRFTQERAKENRLEFTIEQRIEVAA